MTLSLDRLRRAAKTLRKDYTNGRPDAQRRVQMHPPRSDGAELRHADFLHVIAQENSFASWPALKLAAETMGLDRAAKQQRLKIALFHGQTFVVQQLLQDRPDLAEGAFGLQVALYDLSAVEAALRGDPSLAIKMAGPRRPILHLAFSRYFQARPDLEDQMMAIANLLRAFGADVNDVMEGPDGHPLSALYGAIGHANNMRLGQWLLDHGADPNDGESLYHATELGHHEGLRMLLAAGADPRGTNALLRALDFNDHGAVEMLIKAGADVNAFNPAPVGDNTPAVIPALHHAARRGCDRRMVDLLLAAGADPAAIYEGTSVYGFARVFGSRPVYEAIEALGVEPRLTEDERLLAAAVDGPVPQGRSVDPVKLPAAYRNLLQQILTLPGRLDQIKRLVALGLEHDLPDNQGVTPVQAAGWAGLPEVMGYFLSLKPNLDHVNAYGGTLLSTIIHGSENCPERTRRDHLSCLRLALEQGAPLADSDMNLSGDEEILAFLGGWRAEHP